MESSWDIMSADGRAVRYTTRKLKYSGAYMGDCTVSVSVSSAEPIAWEVGDYVMFRGEKFTLSVLPKTKKQAKAGFCGEAFVYDDVTFLSLGTYELGRCAFLDVVFDDNNLHYTSLPKFQVYFANADEFAKRLQANLNRIYTNADGSGKWSVAVADGTEIKAQSLSFDANSCLEALNKCNSDLKLNYVVRGRNITIGTKDSLVLYDFEYGRHKSKSVERGGLTSWEKTSKDDQSIITRLRAYGADSNLPYRYYNYVWWRTGDSGEREYIYHKLDDKVKDAETFEITVDGKTYNRLINPAMYVPNLMLPSFRDGSQTYVTNPGETPEHVVVDAYIDSENVQALGILEGVKYFDGSGSDTEKIEPSLKGMTSQNVADGLSAAERKANNLELGDDGKVKFDEGELDVVAGAGGFKDNDGIIPETETNIDNFFIYVKNLGFDIKDYIGDKDTASIEITEGACAGRSFEIVNTSLVMKSDDGSFAPCQEEWKSVPWYYRVECKVTEDTSIQRYFPYSLYPIREGDKFVVSGINMPDVYVRAAEQRLLTEAKKYLALNDHTTYTYKPSVDAIMMNGNQDLADNIKEGCTFHIVNYDEGAEFDESITISQLEITCGEDALPQYEITLSDEIEATLAQRVTQQVSEALGGGVMNAGGSGGGSGAKVQIITTLDTTRATERNVFSALRSEAQFANKEQAYADFLRKNQDDTAKGKITFEGGAEATELAVTTLATILREYVGKIGSEVFADGLLGSGWQIWQDEGGVSAMTLDKLTVRQTMTVLELLIAKVRSVGGQIVVSAANGKIKAVDGSTVTLEEGAGLWAVGDWARCATYTGGDIKSYWVRVTAVSGDTLTLDTSGLAKGTVAVGDELVLLGNDTDTKRQNAVVISATEDGQPRVDVLDGIKSPSLNGCLRARLGNLDGITDGAFPADAQPSGNGLYADNAFLRGTFVLADGSDVKQLFELIDGRLNSVISDDWESKNLLANGWLLNGLLGWSDRQTTATPTWGGTAMAMHGGVLTAYGWPVVRGKASNPPKWELLTEDGMPYIHELESGDGFSVVTDYVTQPTAASRLVLKLLWRDQLGNAEADVDVEVVGKNADGKTVEWMSRNQTDGTTDWAWWTVTTDEEFASIDYVVINAEFPIDIAKVSLTEERLNSSQIEQTANRISLSVTEKNNDKLKKAGIDIDAQSITLSAETTMIKDADGNDVAVFENGKIKTAFLDLGTLEISSEDIPMLGEVITEVRREPVEGQFTTLNVTGTAETSLDVDLFKDAFTSPAGGWKGYKVYFQCKPTLDSRLSLVSEEVTVDYDEKIADEAWKVIEGWPCDREGNYNWSFTAAKEIKNLTIHYRAVVKVTSASQAQVGGSARLDIKGFQGGDTLALVPTTTTKTPITKTMVGANGFMTAWMSNFIFHIQSNDKTYVDEDGNETAQPAGCTIMAGQYGWRVSASGGIELTKNQGLSWTKA